MRKAVPKRTAEHPVDGGLIVASSALVRQELRAGVCAVVKSAPVRVVQRGECALVTLLEKQVNILVIGLSLPDWDGIDVALAAQRIGAARQIVLCVDRSCERDFDLLHVSESTLLSSSCVYPGYWLRQEVVFATGLGRSSGRHVSADLQRDWRRRRVERRSYLHRLTPAQVRFLAFAGGGLGDKEVSDHFRISVHTARAHRKDVMRKLDLHSHAEMIRYASICGLVRFTEERVLRPGFDVDQLMASAAKQIALRAKKCPLVAPSV